MGKLTSRLIKYFIGIIMLVCIFCFIASGFLLPYIYTNMQYSELRTTSKKIHDSIYSKEDYSNIISENQISVALLIENGKTTTLSSGRTGMVSGLINSNIENLKSKGKYRTHVNQEYLYYKNSTDLGDILVFQINKFPESYMQSTYIILSIIFLTALIISIPIISLLGKRITKPIIRLQKASSDITHGNFSIDADVNTGDEIQELSESLKFMAESLEKKDVMQRDFIANVSHDFKTPLSVIRNYSEALYDDIIEEKGKKEYLKEIIREVDRLNKLVMDVLQLSKLQGGMDILKKENFSLSEFLLDFQSSFKIYLRDKNITMKANLPKEEINIYADSSFLYRVIYNFIDNSIKFTPAGGLIELNAKEEENGMKISVKDNGNGIDEMYIDEIWSRYYKGRKSGGMGLGLAICSEILKLHNFEYGVISQKGNGSEFYFVIPKDSYDISGLI